MDQYRYGHARQQDRNSDGGLPAAFHPVRGPSGGPPKWRHLCGEQGVRCDDSASSSGGGSLLGGGHTHWRHGDRTNVGGKYCYVTMEMSRLHLPNTHNKSTQHKYTCIDKK